MKIYDNIIPVTNNCWALQAVARPATFVVLYTFILYILSTVKQQYKVTMKSITDHDDVRITGFYICVCFYTDNITRMFFKSISFPLEI